MAGAVASSGCGRQLMTPRALRVCGHKRGRRHVQFSRLWSRRYVLFGSVRMKCKLTESCGMACECGVRQYSDFHRMFHRMTTAKWSVLLPVILINAIGDTLQCMSFLPPAYKGQVNKNHKCAFRQISCQNILTITTAKVTHQHSNF